MPLPYSAHISCHLQAGSFRRVILNLLIFLTVKQGWEIPTPLSRNEEYMGKHMQVGEECSRPGIALQELQTKSWTFTKAPPEQVLSSGFGPLSIWVLWAECLCPQEKSHVKA